MKYLASRPSRTRIPIKLVEGNLSLRLVKRASVKSLKTKKLNKKVLGEFIELVA